MTQLLTDMRKDRGGMVQTFEQVELVYRMIARYARKNKLLGDGQNG